MAEVSDIFGGDRYACDPVTCNCNNICNRESGRGACPCKQTGRKCTKFCTCGTKKLPCRNRTQKRGRLDLSPDVSSDDEPAYSFIDDDDETDDNPAETVGTPQKTQKKKAAKKGKKMVHSEQHPIEDTQTVPSGLQVEEELVLSYAADDRQDEDNTNPVAARDNVQQGQTHKKPAQIPQPSQPDSEDITVEVEAFLQSKDETEVRAICLQLLRRHPEDLPGLVEASPDHEDDPDDDDNDGDDEGDNPEWCKCGHCRDMPTEIESVCCRRRIGECVILNAHFGTLIVDPEALELAMAQRMDLLQLGDRPGNNAYRHSAYKSYIYWRCGQTGRYNRVVIPSCAVSTIRDRYPSGDGHYTGFRLHRF